MRQTTARHPVLLVTYLVLFAYAHNFEFAPPVAVVARVLALAIGAILILWFALSVWTGERLTSAIVASGSTLLFISYGHVRNLITAWSWGVEILSIEVGFLKLTVLTLVLLATGLALWVRRASSESIRQATVVLNTAAMLLVAFTVARLGSIEVRAHSPSPHETMDTAAMSATPQRSVRRTELPDIYYIILDTYGRSDVIRNLYGYDNRDFIEWLTDHGFYVADRSTSNYSQTMLSLASSLNLGYLDPVALRSTSAQRAARSQVKFNWATSQLFASPNENQRLPLAQMIQNSEVVERLKRRGYRFVAFTSGYGGVQFPDADVVKRASVMSDFEEAVIGTTPLPDVFDRIFDQRELQRDRVRYVFDHLGDNFGTKGPVFVFAHVMSPHSPFVFRADGSPAPARSPAPNTWYDDDIERGNAEQQYSFITGYRGQIEYVDRQIRRVLEPLLADRSRRRIIILQGDHGPNMLLKTEGANETSAAERLSILNAYYVPPEVRADLYPSITPVNTFRVLFNRYFGESEPRLPDRNYLSPAAPYDFIDMTGRLADTVNPPE